MTRPAEYLEMAATLLRGARLRKYDADEKLSVGVLLAPASTASRMAHLLCSYSNSSSPSSNGVWMRRPEGV